MSTKNKYSSLRWILLAAGIIAIISLTAMNVYSLYALRNNTIETEKEAKKLQVSEFADQLRWKFINTFSGLANLNMEHVDHTFTKKGQLPKKAIYALDNAAKKEIFSDIYYIPANSDICKEDPDAAEFLRYSPSQNKLIKTTEETGVICDGFGIAKTRMKVLMDGYKYSNKVIFDTHRSMTIALINLNERRVFGYLIAPFDQNYLVENYLQPKLQKKFGNPDKSGVVVWMRDWTKDEIIAKSDPESKYHTEKVKFYKKFSGFFDDWQLEVAYTENPEIAAGNASLIKNMIVLGVAFFLLSGALVFMFITAQRERALAERQAGFLANVTHELKTPLAVMQAAGENLADGRVDDRERLKSYGNHIYNEAVRLKKMIDKLLDVAKADAGDALLEPKTVHLDELTRQFINEHIDYIENKGFTVKTSIEDNIPATKMDVESFETIIGNLVENAIKYSKKEKFVHIALYETGDQIILRIEDRGSGINKKSIKHIFKKFYRAEDALTAKTKGHGLGLSIVKNLVELNGGSIEVQSEEQKGTTFLITFPVIEDVESGFEKELPEVSPDAAQPISITNE